MPQILTQGPPNDSNSTQVKWSEYVLESMTPTKILLKFHAAPINPLDIYVLKRMYPVKPQHSYRNEPILGFDGVAEVLECGDAVQDLHAGDFVVPKDYGLGTWRSHAVLDSSKVQKIPRPLDVTIAAVLKLGVLPAYLLVEDVVPLKPGDWIILNAATSVVAQFAVQFARGRGVHAICMIRDRPAEEVATVKTALESVGADLVLTETEVASQTPTLKSKRIVLALDSVFGHSAQLLLATLTPGATFAQLGLLGGAGGKLELATSDLFARQITLRGFRSSALWAKRSALEQLELLAWFVRLANEGELVLPPLGLERVAWDTASGRKSTERVVAAVERVERGGLGLRKAVLVFQ